MIYEFMNTIFSPFGINVLTYEQLCNSFTFTEWYLILRPDVIVSWLFYFAFAYGMLYICFILPFRWFKRIIKAPDKKGHRS